MDTPHCGMGEYLKMARMIIVEMFSLNNYEQALNLSEISLIEGQGSMLFSTFFKLVRHCSSCWKSLLATFETLEQCVQNHLFIVKYAQS